MHNIIYIHGYGSHVMEKNFKYDALAQLGKVYPVAPNFDKPFAEVMTELQQHYSTVAKDAEVHLIVGTSMGGFTASHVGAALNLPFVSLNPCIFPVRDLPKITGRENDYPDFCYVKAAFLGAVTLNMGDELLDSLETQAAMNAHNINCYCLEGGDHLFSNISEILPFIEKHMLKTQLALSPLNSRDTLFR